MTLINLRNCFPISIEKGLAYRLGRRDGAKAGRNTLEGAAPQPQNTCKAQTSLTWLAGNGAPLHNTHKNHSTPVSQGDISDDTPPLPSFGNVFIPP